MGGGGHRWSHSWSCCSQTEPCGLSNEASRLLWPNWPMSQIVSEGSRPQTPWRRGGVCSSGQLNMVPTSAPPLCSRSAVAAGYESINNELPVGASTCINQYFTLFKLTLFYSLYSLFSVFSLSTFSLMRLSRNRKMNDVTH